MNGSEIVQLQFLQAAIRLTPPVALTAIGAVLTGRSGMLVFALEGMMLIGAFVAAMVSYFFINSWLGVLAAVLVGMLSASIFAYLFLKHKVDLLILAIAFNILAGELTVFFLKVLTGNEGAFSDPKIVLLPEIKIPILSQIPVLRQLFSGYNLIVYLTLGIVLATYYLLNFTPFGRHIRATGENIEAARTAGINVNRVRTITLLISGALAGLGGAYLSVGHLSMFSMGMSGGRGFSGLVAALFANNNPVGAFFASLFFGAADAIAMRLQGVTTMPTDIILMLPHISTMILISLVGMRIVIMKNLARRQVRTKAEQLLAGKNL